MGLRIKSSSKRWAGLPATSADMDVSGLVVKKGKEGGQKLLAEKTASSCPVLPAPDREDGGEMRWLRKRFNRIAAFLAVLHSGNWPKSWYRSGVAVR